MRLTSNIIHNAPKWGGTGGGTRQWTNQEGAMRSAGKGGVHGVHRQRQKMNNSKLIFEGPDNEQIRRVRWGVVASEASMVYIGNVRKWTIQSWYSRQSVQGGKSNCFFVALENVELFQYGKVGSSRVYRSGRDPISMTTRNEKPNDGNGTQAKSITGNSAIGDILDMNKQLK